MDKIAKQSKSISDAFPGISRSPIDSSTEIMSRDPAQTAETVVRDGLATTSYLEITTNGLVWVIQTYVLKYKVISSR